jgi:hypothetical protein
MYYAGGPPQVTEYVCLNLQKSRHPPALCNIDGSNVRLGADTRLHGLINYKDTKN